MKTLKPYKVIKIALFVFAFTALAPGAIAHAQSTSARNTFLPAPTRTIAVYYCGAPPNQVPTSINFGCKHVGNPITDLAFAIIRLLSDGVGIVVIGSVIVGGIQYTSSRGDPKATEQAITRIRSSLMALLIFIFAYAILNYVIPQGLFGQ